MLRLRTLVAAAAFTLAAGAAHANQACMMEGKGSFMGVAIAVKDCAESSTLSTTDLKMMCEGLVNTVPGMQSKITYMDKCPSGAWGGCKNLFGKPVTAFYYHPDPNRQKNISQGCAQLGGSWLPAN